MLLSDAEAAQLEEKHARYNAKHAYEHKDQTYHQFKSNLIEKQVVALYNDKSIRLKDGINFNYALGLEHDLICLNKTLENKLQKKTESKSRQRLIRSSEYKYVAASFVFNSLNDSMNTAENKANSRDNVGQSGQEELPVSLPSGSLLELYEAMGAAAADSANPRMRFAWLRRFLLGLFVFIIQSTSYY